MAERNLTVTGSPVPSHPRRPETFAGTSFGVVLPAGAGPFFKVTSSDTRGLGEYFTTTIPPTRESARRRLTLPETNRAEEVRECMTVRPVYAVVGTIADGTANDVQFETRESSAFVELERHRIPPDGEVRMIHVLESAVGFALLGVSVGYALKRPLRGLAVGIVAGVIIGLLFPTDWTELSCTLMGRPTNIFEFAPG